MSSSQTFSTKDPIVLGSLEVPGQLALAGVRMEFSALLEVYALVSYDCISLVLKQQI